MLHGTRRPRGGAAHARGLSESGVRIWVGTDRVHVCQRRERFPWCVRHSGRELDHARGACRASAPRCGFRVCRDAWCARRRDCRGT